MNQPAETLYIPDETDCRTCNICVSHCPTYRIKRQPQESPRGRLKLISKVLNKEQALTEEETEHLNNCVECRACEKVCPSKMHYRKLLDKTRDRLPTLPVPPVLRALLYCTSHRAVLPRLLSGLRLYQKSGLQGVAKKLGLLRLTQTEIINDMLPSSLEYTHVGNFYPASATRKGAVGLFTGCLTNVLDNPTLHAAIKVLNRFGFDVHVPQQQQCCGAIHQHNGDETTAGRLAELNLRAFQGLDVAAIVFTASACGSRLHEYQRRHLSDETQVEVESFSSKLQEINAFIAGQEWPEDLKLQPLNQRVAVHEPCSQRFPLGVHEKPYQFLKRIPGIDLIPLQDNHICCGAGGTYMLTHPEMSDEIRADKLKHIHASGAQIVVTSNIGCALHLTSGISREQLNIAVAHPIDVLARQIQSSTHTP